MAFEERVRFQIVEHDLAKTLAIYRKVHALFRGAPKPPLSVELLRTVGDAHSFEERLVFHNRAHFEGAFVEFLRTHPEARDLYSAVPYLGRPDYTYWETAQTPPKQFME